MKRERPRVVSAEWRRIEQKYLYPVAPDNLHYNRPEICLCGVCVARRMREAKERKP